MCEVHCTEWCYGGVGGGRKGGRRGDPAEALITLSHFKMNSFVSPRRPENLLRNRLHMLISKPNASKQYHQPSPVCFSCFYRGRPVTTFLFQSHYGSVGTVIFLYCGFQGLKITFSLASLKFIVNINRPK